MDYAKPFKIKYPKNLRAKPVREMQPLFYEGNIVGTIYIFKDDNTADFVLYTKNA